MAENDDQKQQSPERPTPRHSAPNRQQPQQFTQGPPDKLPEPQASSADPLLGQSPAPAPPPSPQSAQPPAQRPTQPLPQPGPPGQPPMGQAPMGQRTIGRPPMGQQQSPYAGNGPQAPINSNQHQHGPNQDAYRPNQPGPSQNSPGQQAPYGQRPPQQGQPQQGQPQHGQPQQSIPQHGQPPTQYGQPLAHHGQPQVQYGQQFSQYGQSAGQQGPPLQDPPPSRYGPSPQQQQVPQDGQPSYGLPQHGQPPFGQPPFGQPAYVQPPYGQALSGQPPYGQPLYGQPQRDQMQQGQPQYGQPQYGQPPQGGAPWQAANGPRLPAGQESPGQYGSDGPGTPGAPLRSGDRNRTPRLVGALALLIVAVITTVTCVSWVWNKADAITPVALPSAKGTPLKTVSPYVQPSETPPPTGKVVGSNMVASNNDRMPILSSAWSDNYENSGLYGGASIWLTVHKNYDGHNTWGDYVAFGGLNKTIPFTNTPAGLKEATAQAASIAIVRLYDKNVKFAGKATHRTITVKGHPGHEVTVKVVVSKPKLKETYSTVAVAVIDRGDGTGMVAVGDFAGSTQQWLPIWRAKVQQITFAH